MIDKIKNIIKIFKVNTFVKSAIRSGIINHGNGIDFDTFILYIDNIPNDLKDDFTDRIYNLAIEDKMDAEITSQNRMKYIKRVQDFLVK